MKNYFLVFAVLFFQFISTSVGFSQAKVTCMEYVNFSNQKSVDYKSINIVFHSDEKSVSYTLPYKFSGTGLIKVNADSARRMSNNIYVTASDTIRKYVFKNFNKSELFFQAPLDIFYKENKVFSDSLYNFKWKISNETKLIDSFLCKKATMTFRNRNYTTWFCEDVPLNNGPWKFGGLPGLIIEIEDDEKVVFWKLSRLFRTGFNFPDFPTKTDGNFLDYKNEFKTKFLKFKKALESSDNVSDPNCGNCSSSRTVMSNTPEKLAN